MLLTVAEMYVTGVSTRRVEKVMQSMGIESISSTPVSRANQSMDEALKVWRDRPLGAYFYNRGHRILRSVATCTKPSNGQVILT